MMKRYILGSVGFFCLVMFCFAALGLQTIPRNLIYVESEHGEVDLLHVDFEKDVVELRPALFAHYPEQLLQPEETGVTGGELTTPYGTRRIRLRLPPDQAYAVSMTCPDFAFRIMADGREIASMGTVGTTAAESHALAGTVYGAFTPKDEETELSFWYAGFVRGYGPPGMYLGTVENIAKQQTGLVLRNVLYAGAMLTACLLFLGMFLFFGRKRQFFYFAGCCLALCLYALVTESIPLTLLFPLDAVIIARLEYLAVWIGMFFLFAYIQEVFQGVFHRVALWAGGAVLATYVAAILLLAPRQFTAMRVAFTVCAGILILYAVLCLLIRARRLKPEQKLVLIAAVMLITVGFAEKAVLRWVLPYWIGNGFLSATAMIGMIFLNMIALSIYAMRAENERDEALRMEKALAESNRSLDRLNQLQREFLQTASHELRTPLAVMSGHAQLSAKKLRMGLPAEDIPRQMDVITREADRLSRLVSHMLEREVLGAKEQSAICDVSPILRHCAELL